MQPTSYHQVLPTYLTGPSIICICISTMEPVSENISRGIEKLAMSRCYSSTKVFARGENTGGSCNSYVNIRVHRQKWSIPKKKNCWSISLSTANGLPSNHEVHKIQEVATRDRTRPCQTMTTRWNVASLGPPLQTRFFDFPASIAVHMIAST